MDRFLHLLFPLSVQKTSIPAASLSVQKTSAPAASLSSHKRLLDQDKRVKKMDVGTFLAPFC